MTTKVLIADDSLMVRLQAQRHFESLARPGIHSFCFAGDGAQALEVIDQGGIDVLLSDLNMPGMDGMELLRALQNHPARPGRIIIMTSAVGPLLAQELEKWGVDGLIAKPVTAVALGAVLAKPGKPVSGSRRSDIKAH